MGLVNVAGERKGRWKMEWTYLTGAGDGEDSVRGEGAAGESEDGGCGCELHSDGCV
tara:strand:+ start:126 stop:293 length:168 start_codon:yes stop_codon:yes gene_type:complete